MACVTDLGDADERQADGQLDGNDVDAVEDLKQEEPLRQRQAS